MSNVRLSLVPAYDLENHVSATLGALLSVARTLACVESLPSRTRRRYTSILRQRLRYLRAALASDSAPPSSRLRPSLVAPPCAPKGVQDVILETLVDAIDLEQHGAEHLRVFSPQLDAITALLDVAAARCDELTPRLAHSSMSEMMERTVRGCLASLQYRGIIVLASSVGGSALFDTHMIERALIALLQHVIGTMPRGTTIEVTFTAGESLSLDISFSGPLVAPGAASLMSSQEIVYFRAVAGAHGGTIALDERSGRTAVHVELPSYEAPTLGRCA